MKIIVIGAGKVGYSLSERLVQDGHDVYLVEKSADRVRNLEHALDVHLVEGSGSDLSLLNEIGDDAGMLIAVTDSDEVNMLACAVAKIAGIPKTIARVRDNAYEGEDSGRIRAELGVDLFINPEMVTAQELLDILETPSALDVEDFGNGRVRLLEIKMRDNSAVVGRRLQDIGFPEGVLVAGILRGGEMIIPNGSSVIAMFDNVFFLGSIEGIQELEGWFSSASGKTERIAIIGAGLIGRHLTLLLEEAGYSVKVIEKRMDRCECLAGMVDRAMIICGDGTDAELLESEEIGDSDAIICLTDDDKLNLLVALLAKHMGVDKTFVRVGRPEYISLMEQVGIDVVFSPRLLTSGEILRLVRTGKELVGITSFGGAKAEAVELVIGSASPVVGRALKQIKLPTDSLVGAVVHGDDAVVPRGDTVLCEGDRIVIFTLPERVHDILAYFGQ